MATSIPSLEVSRPDRFRRLLGQYFYLFMSLLILAIVVSGFSRTVDRRLIHAVPVRPWVLYLHGIVFFGWVIFFIAQSALVRVRKVKVHRTLGWFGVALGVVIPVLGMWTSITMDRFEIFHFHLKLVSPFLAVQIESMVAFAILFALAIVWRKKPEYHRRSILLGSCMLTGAAFSRIFGLGSEDNYVNLLLLLGVLRDLIVNKRVHPVYLYGVPVLIVGGTTAMHLFLSAPAWWVRIADAILRVS
jgi:hypothetical protein